MENNTNNSGSGIGFTGLLAIAFIVLKLLGKISWPWVWVLCPLWIVAAIGLIAWLVIVINIWRE